MTTVTHDADSTLGAAVTASNVSWSHTVGSGSNAALYVFASLNSAPPSNPTATYNGIAMTLIANVGSRYVYRLTNPPSGTHTIQVTATVTQTWLCEATSFFGVDPYAPEGTIVTDNAGTPTLVNDSATGTANGMIWDGCGAGFSGLATMTLGTGTGQTLAELDSNGTGSLWSGTSYMTATGSAQAFKWQFDRTCSSHGHIVVPINPVAAYSQTLTAPISVGATLSIKRTLNPLLSASVLTAASLQRVLTKNIPATVSETATVNKGLARSFAVTVSEGASLIRGHPRTLTPPAVNMSAALAHGLAHALTLTPAAQTISATLSQLKGKTFSAVVLMTPSVGRYAFHGLVIVPPVSIIASLKSQRALARTLSASVSMNPSVSNVRSLGYSLSTDPVNVTARVNHLRNVGLLAPTSVAASVAHQVNKVLSAAEHVTPSLSRHQVIARSFPVVINEGATMQGIKAKVRTFNTVVNESATARGVPTRFLTANVTITAMINKRGRYPMPPAVLEMFDLVDPYRLPALKGATVAYVHGILGFGVLFDIYAAYVAASGAFYVCDNGLKQALNQHPAVVRVV